MRTPLPKLLAHPGTLSTFLRKLPTLLGKRGGGLAFRNGARAADSFQSQEGTSASATRPIRKARPHPRRVPSGRRVLGLETFDTPRKKLCKNLL